jgi:hypothetical protein
VGIARLVIALLVLTFFTLAASSAWHHQNIWLLVFIAAGWLLCGIVYLTRYGWMKAIAKNPAARWRKVIGLLILAVLWMIPYTLREDAKFSARKPT